jgi:hypothetical protein
VIANSLSMAILAPATALIVLAKPPESVRALIAGAANEDATESAARANVVNCILAFCKNDSQFIGRM